MRAWRYLQQGGSVEYMQAFLYRTARNAIINHAKKNRPVSLDELSDSGFDASAHGISEIDRADFAHVVRILDRLDDAHREVVILRYINGLEPREIAEALSVSANVVSVRLHRAMEKLRDHLSSNMYA